ncbi:hypothetical protein A7U60_g3378 [Sanghuangporus baumii]|uniref:Uncharacterized protein n=1 Tax=Sanghuangporus baumii TaxID=108892 RepID=A0A9Q5N6X2_SANBA|nr:hypothetical protein A7U60_g3378 [Sanghuangporus baumii]
MVNADEDFDELASDEGDFVSENKTSSKEDVEVRKLFKTSLHIADAINTSSPILLDALADKEQVPIVQKGMERGKGKKLVVKVKESDMDLGNKEWWKI